MGFVRRLFFSSVKTALVTMLSTISAETQAELEANKQLNPEETAAAKVAVASFARRITDLINERL